MRATAVVVVVLLLFAFPLAAQEPPAAAENPLTALRADLTRVLGDANFPFTSEQEREITLMMDERLRASETLFGSLMDFTAGPTSGQNAEQLQSAIGWLHNEFLTRVRDHLTTDQLAVWEAFQATARQSAATALEAGAKPQPPQQTQYVRINNNRFTAEDLEYQTGGGGGGGSGTATPVNTTEVIQRGGSGGWHGNFQNLFKDDALNARNVFAANKPPYQERRVTFDVGGPVLPGRLTSNINFEYGLAQNVDTINALLPDGRFALGITKPTVNRSIGSRSTYQFSNAHSLAVNVAYASENYKNEGIGGFTLRERGSTRDVNEWNVELRQFAALSSGSLYETRFNIAGGRSATIPFNDDVRINVSDTFNSGGAQNHAESTERTYEFSNLYTRLGQKLTIKTGIEGAYRSSRSHSIANFGGTYTFASLDDYLAGTANTYRVARGEPLHDAGQLEFSAFLQNDLAITRQLQLMFGFRYDAQGHLPDYNNFSPRVGVAYGVGGGVILRGGLGLFYEYLPLDRVMTQERFDGARQFEIIIDKPVYPDPFSGTVRQTLPSVRVTDPNLIAPYTTVAMISMEKTFWTTFLVSVTYDHQNNNGRFVYRDLNQPRDISSPVPTACTLAMSASACVRPDPTRGSVLNLESTSFQDTHNVRVNIRHRFSIFNVTGSYLYFNGFEDGSDYGTSTNSYDRRADWSPRGQSRHTGSGSVNARLPLGIFLTNTLSMNSGRFYSITTGKDDNQDGITSDRPAGTGRNSVNGPGRVNLDMNLSKAFFLSAAGSAGTRTNVNLFINVTNVFNRTHYGNPSGVMSSSNFGRFFSATDPREVEVGVRFQF